MAVDPTLMPAFDLHFQHGGVHLPHLNLWLDPREIKRGSERVFISQADRFENHRELILTEPTALLTRAAVSNACQQHVLPFDQSFAPQNSPFPYEITLLSAGPIFGTTMAWLFDGRKSLLYTGDFKMTTAVTGESCQPRPADILILETIYGRPVYRFPPRAEVIQNIVRFCEETLENSEIPILLGDSLGKNADVFQALASAALPMMLDDTVQQRIQIYGRSGVAFPQHHPLNAESAHGHVLICPTSFTASTHIKNLGKIRTALLSGSALDPESSHRLNADVAFPLSDHADFSELLQMVQQVNPKKVYTIHGFAADFASTLREMGYDAQPLSEPNQLNLGIQIIPTQPNRRRPLEQSATPQNSDSNVLSVTSFEMFVRTCTQISVTTKKTEKTQILADYFQQLPSEQLSHAATWFTGTPFVSSQNRTLQLGWAIIRDALCFVGEIDHSQFGQIYLKHSELGECALEILSITMRPEQFPSLTRIHELFLQLHAAKGPTGKAPLLRKAFLESSPLAAKFLVKILTGDLRIGLKEGLVEESLARAFGCSLESVKSSHLLLGDIGQTATLSQSGQLDSVTLVPFRPVRYMLASPEETSGDIWSRISGWQSEREIDAPLPLWTVSPAEGWSEQKYDGVRAQIHKVGSHVEIYSRDLKAITGAFMEIADRLRTLPQNLIIDGEIIAMRGETVLPYHDLQKRLGRREVDLFLSEEIPTQFMAFDLLWLDSKNLLREPLWARRQALGELAQHAFRLSQISSVRSAEQIENAFTAAKDSGNEGLMIKDPSSIYTPGRRGMSWLKYKKNFATLDCVVVGVEYGHGKRNMMLSVYTVALRDELSGELKTIGKTFIGLTDLEIATLTQHFLKETLSQTGRYLAVKPTIVVEMTFDLIQISARHESGLAMRFPRIVRLRPDKAPEQIDMVATARALVEMKTGVPKNSKTSRNS